MHHGDTYEARVTIPAFNDNGYLPPGRHETDAPEIEHRLVQPYTRVSPKRRLIFDMWRLHTEALVHHIPIQEEWLDGSFVSNVLEPGDLDIVVLLDAVQYEQLPDHLQAMVDMLVSGKFARSFWRCDVIAIFCYPPDDSRSEASARSLEAYDDFFSHDRDGQDKGYLIVQ